MIEIRRKREIFHQTIRIRQRDSIRQKMRNDLTFLHQDIKKRKDFLNLIEEPFSFCQAWEQERTHIWNKEASQLDKHFDSPYQFVKQISLAFKEWVAKFQTNENAKIDISLHLIENLPFLIPPPSEKLYELPLAFIQMCLYILKDPKLDSRQKQNFIETFPHETIIRCLLNYFVENWTQIKTNKCNDIVMNFLLQFNKHKNIFTKTMYYDSNFETLLQNSINEIQALTWKERQVYNIWNANFEEFQIQQQNDCNGGQHLISYLSNEYPEQEKLFYVMKNAIFLSNLLLLSPMPNFNIKEAKKSIKNIAFYLYRKILLNEYDIKCKMPAEFCVSVLLCFGSDTHLHKEIQIIDNILDSSVQRLKLRNAESKMNGDKDFEIDQVIPTKVQNLEEYESFVMDEQTDFFLNRINLLMVSSLAQNSHAIKFSHIQKWLKCQFKNQKNNIFDLNNAEIIQCLLSLLKKIIQNQVSFPHTYKSYSTNQMYVNICEEQIFAVKTFICKMFQRNGFQSLFDHTNLKNYSGELCQLLCQLMAGLDQIGDISAVIFSYFTVQNYREFDELELDSFLQDDTDHEDSQFTDQNQPSYQSSTLSTVKIFIYNTVIKFLSKSYKLLSYEQKEKLLMHLVNSDNLSSEDVKKYLTFEETQRFKQATKFSWESYNSDQDFQLEDDEDEEDEEIEDSKQFMSWKFQDKTESSPYQGYQDVEI